MSITLKQQLFDFCNAFAKERIERIHQNIAEIQTSLSSETKSSAGDKHETGRAMLQLEREKLGHQLAEAEKMAAVLARIPLAKPSTTVILGSWVKTSKADYFLAVSAGECIIGANGVFCISAATPMARLLLSKSVGEVVSFRGENIKILEIR